MKTKRKIKDLSKVSICIMVMLVLFIVPSQVVNAETQMEFLVSSEKYNESNQPIPISDLGAENNIESEGNYTRALSPEKTKTNNIVTTFGTVVGTATLYYRTDIIGGRPQFVYEYTKLSWAITNPNYTNLGNPTVSFTGDLVKAVFNLSNWGIPVNGNVSFTP